MSRCSRSGSVVLQYLSSRARSWCRSRTASPRAPARGRRPHPRARRRCARVFLNPPRQMNGAASPPMPYSSATRWTIEESSPPTETGGVIGVGERKRDVKGRAGLLLDVAVAPPPSPARACLPSSQPMSKLSLPQIQPTIPKLIPPPPFCDSSKLIPSPRPVACM